MKKKVFICGLVQESNSFNPVLTDFEDFSTSGIYDGQALLDSGGRVGETLDGMICAARQRGLELVGGRRMRSKSGGPVDHAVVEDFLKRTLDGIEQTGALDGVLLSLTGPRFLTARTTCAATSCRPSAALWDRRRPSPSLWISTAM